jgi:DNA-binding NtrC family response regulator
MSSQTVLIVEDDLDLRSAIAENVYEAGYEPVTAKSAEDALELLKTVVRPCVVLLDFLMPGVGADGFLTALEALADADEFKIVLMTGMQGAKLRSDARVVHRLMKPFEMELLLGILVQHCGQPAPRLAEG